MTINEFIWPRDRVEHIGKHGVEPNEVEEVCFGESLVQRTKSSGKNPVYYILGTTSAGRHLFWVEATMKSQRIPETDSIEELAKFWDTHDLTDFEDQLEKVRGVFKRRKESTVAIDLTPKEAQDLKRLAESAGIQEAALVRKWVREKLRESSLRMPPNKPLQPPAQKTRRG